MEPTNRLRTATRIHFVLLRHFDVAVEVSELLSGAPEGREALWVCEACGDPELATLARQLARANRNEATAAARRAETIAASRAAAAARRPVAPAGRVPQETVWSQQTSGFSMTRPLDLAHPAAPPAASAPWFKPMNWLRRGATR